jgi:hypothetical protein
VSDWNKRWFTIEGDDLTWYHSNAGTDSAGSVKISSIKKVSLIKANKTATTSQGTTTFVIKSATRSLFLRSETPADCSRWVRCIQMQMDLRSGGTAAGPKCKKNQRESNGGGDKFAHMIRQIEKTMEQLEIVEQVASSPQNSKGGDGFNSRGNNSYPVDDDDGGDNDRSNPDNRYSESDKGPKQEVWGGRLQFENDKSILESVSPKTTGRNDAAFQQSAGQRKQFSKEPSKGYQQKGGSQNASPVLRASSPSILKQQSSPSTNSDFDSSGDFSPSMMKAVDRSRLDKGKSKSLLQNNLIAEDHGSRSDERSSRSDERSRRDEGSRNAPPKKQSSSRSGHSSRKSGKNHINSYDDDMFQSSSSRRSRDSSPIASREAAPLPSPSLAFSPMSATKKGKKSRSKQKNLEDSLESSADFETSYESSSMDERASLERDRKKALEVQHIVVAPAKKTNAFMLEEFQDLDELEGIRNEDSDIGGGHRRGGGPRRVSLVRTSRDGESFVVPDPHSIKTGW